MSSPEDELLLSMWRGRDAWGGEGVDAERLAIFLEGSEQRPFQLTTAAVARVIGHLLDAGLVGPEPAIGGGSSGRFVLTEAGLARARELEARPHRDSRSA